MTASASVSLPSEATAPNFAFTDADFRAIARLAQADFGLHLTEAKKTLVYSRLVKRLRHLGLTDFAAYCRLLEGPNGQAERIEMLSSLTTNVTHFFREQHHFDTLRSSVLPPLIAAARGGRRVRLWSAGCSAGQEPYSLAFTLLDLLPDAARHDIRVLATDVDPAILARANRGIYDEDELKSLPAAVRSRFLETDGAGRLTVGAAARALIRFNELNLMHDWPFHGTFDVIFCRNVAIYFDKPVQARLWARFADLMPTGGTLCIGHSERVSGPAADWLEPAGVTTYRKVGTAKQKSQSATMEGAAR